MVGPDFYTGLFVVTPLSAIAREILPRLQASEYNKREDLGRETVDPNQAASEVNRLNNFYIPAAIAVLGFASGFVSGLLNEPSFASVSYGVAWGHVAETVIRQVAFWRSTRRPTS